MSTTVILAVVLAVMSLLLTGGQVLPLLLPPCLVVVGVLTDLASPSSPLLHCRTSLWLASPLPALLAVTSESPLISLAVSLGLVVLLTSWNLTAATASLSSLPLSLGLLTSVMAGLVSSPLTSLGLSSPELSLPILPPGPAVLQTLLSPVVSHPSPPHNLQLSPHSYRHRTEPRTFISPKR